MKRLFDMDINSMTTQEKLRAMEMLWDDLCRNAPEMASPSWHEDILKKREKDILEGKDEFVDWDQAKKDIWKSIA